MRSPAEKVALCASFTALGLILSYVEAILPISLLIPIPGFKLGLASLAVMLTYFALGRWYALAVSLCRISLLALLFGNVTSLWFSLAGGIMALVPIMLYSPLLHKRCGILGLSVMCAAMHNVGQCLAASVLFGHYVLTFYLPFLLLVSLLTGSLTGVIVHRIVNIKTFTKGFTR